ncbi:MAG: tRNA 2-thiolation protein NcsA [Halodesulfurarchaeum sp.]
MECDRCGREAVLYAAYSGAHLCDRHLQQSVERRVRRRVRSDDLLPNSATPEDPVTWLIGLSGGKDSAVLTHILAETFGPDPRVELIALSVHEGIAGYRDDSLSAAEALVADRPVEYVETGYEAEFDLQMDQIATEDPWDMAPCAYCGVLRRDVLAEMARTYEADVLLTGHNLDDEAETALMNVLEGDVSQMAQHYDASLAPLSERTSDGPFVPRAKPLRDVPESEVALYARVADIPAHIAECPYASESFRGTVRDVLLELEEDHPGTRHSIMAGYEETARFAATNRRSGAAGPAGVCENCGAPTDRDRCRACELRAELG